MADTTFVVSKDAKFGRFAAGRQPIILSGAFIPVRGVKRLKRRYTTFPGGLPGLGLLALRTAIGASLVTEGLRCVLDSAGLNVAESVLVLLALGTGISFLLGLLTPLGAGVSVLAAATLRFWHPAWVSAFADFSNFNTIAEAIAIFLLGPGAISLDAYFFGRRRIIIPRVVRP